MPSFAADTKVSVEKSKAEIDTLLGKHGAKNRLVGQDDEDNAAVLAFEVAGRRYCIRVPMPTVEESDKCRKAVPGSWNWDEGRRRKWNERHLEQAVRTRWRVALLLIKSKLEIVRMGASSFEKEFLADLVLPNGQTAGETLGAYMAKVIANGYQAPLALPAHEA